MEIHALKCKRMTTNLDGNRVEDKVVAVNGKEWSIADAAVLIIHREAVFFHNGNEVVDLAMLPEC